MAALPQFQNVAHNAPVAVPAQAAAIHQYIQQDQAQILQQLGALTNSVNLLVTAVNASHARYASLFYFFRVWLTQLSTACLQRLPMQLFNATSSNETTLLYPPNIEKDCKT